MGRLRAWQYGEVIKLSLIHSVLTLERSAQEVTFEHISPDALKQIRSQKTFVTEGACV